jgi:hypothetical protein
MGSDGRGQRLGVRGQFWGPALSWRWKRCLMFQRKFGNGLKVDLSGPWSLVATPESLVDFLSK